MNQMLRRLGVLFALTLFVAPTARGQADTISMTDDRLQGFAQQLEDGVNKHDVAAINACFSEPAFHGRILRGFDISKRDRKEIAAGISSSFNLGTLLSTAIGDMGHYKLLKVRSVNGAPRALFRLVSAEGLNYHDAHIAASRSGTLKIVDLYIFASGETLSDTMRRSLSDVLRAQQATGEIPANVLAQGEMSDHLNQGRPQAVLDVYNALPDDAKKDKLVMTLRVIAATRVSPEETNFACRDYALYFPGDPATDLLVIDQHVLNERWEDALMAIERLRVSVGGDPYLDTLVAGVRLGSGDLVAAERAARRAMIHEPDMPDAHLALITIALAQGEYEKVTVHLDKLTNELGYVVEDLDQYEEYAAFVASNEGRRWLASHGGN